MARRIFISYQHADQMSAKAFNLQGKNSKINFDFIGRHLLDPVNSENEGYIKRKIHEQITGTSVTIVVIGKETAYSEWVAWEIRESLKKNNPNGIVGVLLKDVTPPPRDSPVGKALYEAGAEIVEWKQDKIEAAIERAAKATGRIKQIKKYNNVDGSGCNR
ncbi:MAG: TIR domain-containing protein [Methanosarcinaceae archaeon]|nr:TIR domain-containing protein [Methanosarcinaceae archaeon]